MVCNRVLNIAPRVSLGSELFVYDSSQLQLACCGINLYAGNGYLSCSFRHLVNSYTSGFPEKSEAPNGVRVYACYREGGMHFCISSTFSLAASLILRITSSFVILSLDKIISDKESSIIYSASSCFFKRQKSPMSINIVYWSTFSMFFPFFSRTPII